MHHDPIHQNLNTSFVNLTALVRHLWSLQFVGTVRVEFSNYEAEIKFLTNKKLQAREYDHNSRITGTGEAAFYRILAQSREPNGRINVLRTLRERVPRDHPVFVDEFIASGARKMALASTDRPASMNAAVGIIERPTNEAAELAILVGTLLETIDRTMARGNLSLWPAFESACSKKSSEYAFLAPGKGAVRLHNGKIAVQALVAPELFSAAIVDALRVVFERMHGRPRLEKVFTLMRTRVKDLLNSHGEQFDRFGMSAPLRDLMRL